MDEKKIFSYVNFAVKSGEVVYGIDNIKACKKHIFCVILSPTATQNLEDAVNNFCTKTNVLMLKLKQNTIDDLLHTKNCKVVGLTNQSISKQIEYLNSLEE